MASPFLNGCRKDREFEKTCAISRFDSSIGSLFGISEVPERLSTDVLYRASCVCASARLAFGALSHARAGSARICVYIAFEDGSAVQFVKWYDLLVIPKLAVGRSAGLIGKAEAPRRLASREPERTGNLLLRDLAAISRFDSSIGRLIFASTLNNRDGPSA